KSPSNPRPNSGGGCPPCRSLFHLTDVTDDARRPNYGSLYQGHYTAWRYQSCHTVGRNLCPGADCQRLSIGSLVGHGSADSLCTGVFVWENYFPLGMAVYAFCERPVGRRPSEVTASR